MNAHIYILLMHISLHSSFSKTVMARSLCQKEDIFYISINKGAVFQINKFNTLHSLAALEMKS